MENNGRNFGTILISVVFLLWFAASIIGMIYFSKHGQGALMVAIVGHYFVVFGVIGIISSIRSKSFQPFLLLFPLVGGGCIAGALIWQYGSEELLVKAEAMLPYLFICLFMVIGAFMIFGAYLSSRRKQKVCNYYITATCVDVKTQYDDGTRTYCPVYEIYFRNETQTICNNVYTNIDHVGVGDRRELYLNPDNPEEFYEPIAERKTKIFIYVLGSSFVFISALALIIMRVVVK